MAQNTPLINGRAYDYASVTVNILGVPLNGIDSIEYSEEQTKENNFGAGKYAVSRGHGEVNASASMELHMNDVEALRNAAPNGRLLDIPAFDIVVSFLVEGKVKTHTLKNCEFLSDGVSGSQGDTKLTRSFDLVMSHVIYK